MDVLYFIMIAQLVGCLGETGVDKNLDF